MTVAHRLVFIVDDDPSVRRGLRRLLSAAGYRVSTFASGRELLEHTTRETPSCLVVDVRMPGLSGLAIYDALVAAGSRVPIVFITGDGEIPDSARGPMARSVAVLAKPVGDDLFVAVQRMIAAGEAASA